MCVYLCKYVYACVRIKCMCACTPARVCVCVCVCLSVWSLSRWDFVGSPTSQVSPWAYHHHNHYTPYHTHNRHTAIHHPHRHTHTHTHTHTFTHAQHTHTAIHHSYNHAHTHPYTNKHTHQTHLHTLPTHTHKLTHTHAPERETGRDKEGSYTQHIRLPRKEINRNKHCLPVDCSCTVNVKVIFGTCDEHSPSVRDDVPRSSYLLNCNRFV